MTTFRVGQRVRIVGTKHYGPLPPVCGREAVVTGVGCFIGTYSRRPYTYLVRTDSRTVACNADELEPLSDANTLVSWESMRGLWVPDDMREVA